MSDPFLSIELEKRAQFAEQHNIDLQKAYDDLDVKERAAQKRIADLEREVGALRTAMRVNLLIFVPNSHAAIEDLLKRCKES